MNDFYITLPSNTNSEDKTNDFTINLPKTLHLEGQYECALTEFIYPRSWANLWSYKEKNGGDSCTITINFQLYDDLVINVPGAHYASVEELTGAIERAGKQAATEYKLHVSREVYNIEDLDLAERAQLFKELQEQKQRKMEFIAKFGEKINFKYDEAAKRVVANFTMSDIRDITLSEHLQHMLGFEFCLLTESGEMAKYPPDLNSFCQALYVYTDFIEPQMVGNEYYPLLRIVNVDNSEHNSTVEKIYYAPHYLPVIHKYLSFIHIFVHTDSGFPVPFQSGKIVCKLHFRKKRIFIE